MAIYGNLINRLNENKNYTGRKEIKVGDDITMYYWSDRTCYFVTEVISQTKIKVKKYRVNADLEKPRGMGHQNWVYFKTRAEQDDYLKKFDRGSYESEYPEETWVFRYKSWRRVWEFPTEDGKTYTRYEKLQPISFGVRDYYYDWEF